jgi:hypothetical protein
MKELLRTRGNLSVPGLDGITNPLLKLEREKGAKMLLELMKMITETGFCPGEWKMQEQYCFIKKERELNPGIGDLLQSLV